MKMKHKLLMAALILIFTTASFAADYMDRLEKYSSCSEDLKEMIQAGGAESDYAEYILQWSSPEDLSVITPDYLRENIEYAVKARALPYCKYGETIFMRYVLPPRMSQEPFEDWRKYLYGALKPLVEKAGSIEEAAVIVNLWVLEQMTFKPTSGRDQGPLTTLRRGYGRCEESMILYMAACRSVGIPVRAAYAPFWDFMDNNHAWVEVYTDKGWKFAGEAENGLSRTWFNSAAAKAPLVLSNVSGNAEDENLISFDGYSSRVNSTEIYSDSRNVTVTMLDSEGKRVKEGELYFYALSYGGLFPVLKLECGDKGSAENDFGPAPLVCVGVSGSMTGTLIIDSRIEDEYFLQLREDGSLAGEYVMRFSENRPGSGLETERVMDEKLFSLKRENADVKRRLAEKSRLKTKVFAEQYDKILSGKKRDEDYYSKRMEFLDKCEKLGLNTEMYLNALKESSERPMILELIMAWDEKDLCEISSMEQVLEIAEIFSAAKKRFSKAVSDEYFFEHVLKKTDDALQPPENRWRRELLESVDLHLARSLKTSAEKILNAVDSAVRTEERDFTYFTASLNPMEIFRMGHVTDYQKLLLTDALLKMYGIPVRWKGRLEYYNGKKFVPALLERESEGADSAGEFRLRLNVDGEAVEPDPFGNFIVQYVNKNGVLKYAYFEGENKEGVFQGRYRVPDEGQIYVCAYVRNKNGDAALKIVPMSEEPQIDIRRLPEPVTAREHVPGTVMELIRDHYKGGVEIYIFTDENVSEPEIRMSEAAAALSGAAYIAVNGGKRVNSVLKAKDARSLEADVPGLEKPALFLVKDGVIVYQVSGYRTGLETILKEKTEK